ncbi:MAG: peptide deformylase [Bacteroidales bacterium]|nr:peptide deformylase [Bacteroidales bacterium]
MKLILSFSLFLFFFILNNCKKINESFYKDTLFYTANERNIIFNGDTTTPMQIIPVNSEALKKKSKNVKLLNDTTKILTLRLIKTLKSQPNFISLCAPEVGINRKIIVLKRVDKTGAPIEELINPQITYFSSSQVKVHELCITNQNDIPTPIYRHYTIVVKYYDLEGKEFTETFEGQLSYSIQHHFDHFNGKTILDYPNPYKFTQSEIDLIMSGGENEKMRILLITNYNDSLILRKQSIDVYPDTNDTVLIRLIKRMKKTLDLSQGVGIAAPQVGINRNIIWVKRMDKPGQPFEVYLNPKIVLTTQNTIQFNGDGCLSIPNQSGKTIRWPSIGIEYDLLDGKHYSEVVYGYQAYQFTAVIFQHEIDHLNGILFIDRLVGSK